MTLIAAFRCNEGVVFCADSQETLGLPLPDDRYAEYRVSVDKIEPQYAGAYQLVIGGAGDADLVEAFTETLTDAMPDWPSGLDGASLKGRIRNILLDFNRHEVAASSSLEKDIAFLLCVREKDNRDSQVHLWKLGGTTIRRVRRFSLIGWEEGIYRHDVKALYRENSNSLYSVLVGIHVLLLGCATSNNIGPPMKVIFIANSRARLMAEGDVQEIERRVALFDSKLDNLRLRLSDTSIPLNEFANDVAEFHAAVMSLRLTLTGDILETKLKRFIAEVASVGAPDSVDEAMAALSSLYDPYLSLPNFEDSLRAAQHAWETIATTRQSRRGLAEALHTLSLAANVVVKIVSRIYEQKLITLDQKDQFAKALVAINRAAGLLIDESKEISERKTDPIPPEKNAEIYRVLSDEVVRPLLQVVRELRKLFDNEDPFAQTMIDGLMTPVLSIITISFAKGDAEILNEPGNRLGASSQQQLGD